MAKSDNLPFPRGTTFYDGQTPDTTSADAIALEGKTFQIEDNNWNDTSGVKSARSGHYVTLMVVRNVSGIALLAKRMAKMKKTAGNTYLGRVDGMVHLGYGDTANPELAFPIDEFLPTAGCPTNDLCYVVIDGPAVVLTSLATLSATIAVGDFLVHATAATSQATTAGRVQPSNLQAAGTGLTHSREQDRQIGRALSAKTSDNTGADLLIQVIRY